MQPPDRSHCQGDDTFGRDASKTDVTQSEIDTTEAAAAATQPKIVMYATTTCGYCWRAERLLQSKGYTFEIIDVTMDRTRRAWLAQQSGRRTVPQIRIGERWIGGFEEMRDL